jgi:MFS family permease
VTTEAVQARPEKARLVTPLFLLVSLSTFAYFVSVGTLQPTLPRFVEGPLGGSSVAVGVAVGAFSISAVIVRPLAGRISDTHGRRPLIVWGAASVGLATAGHLVVTDLWLLLVLRIVYGVGEAFFFTAAAGVINDLAPDERRGEAVSYFSLALYGGLVLGPVLGEIVLGDGHYNRAWILAAATAALAAVLGLPVPDTRPDEESIPPQGLRRFVHPAALLPGTVLATSMWGLGGYFTFVPLYALELGLSGSRVIFATFSGIILAIRGFGARIPDRLGPRRSARTALTLQACGLLVMALWQNPVGLYAGTVVFAVGQALSFPALMTIAIEGAPASERGAVVGTFTAFFDLAFGLGAVSLGAVVAVAGYPGSFAGGALVAGLGLLLMFTRARRARRAPPQGS